MRATKPTGQRKQFKSKTPRHTHAFSVMLTTLGAYGDTGRVCLPLIEGAPRPDIPETLLRLELDDSGGRVGTLSWLWLWDI
jgi:hypothetical protein